MPTILEQLADEARRGPVGEAHLPASPAHADHLGGGAFLVDGEHRAEGRQHRVEALVGKRQGFDIPVDEPHAHRLGFDSLAAAAGRGRGRMVRRGDVAPAARGGERRLKIAGRHVEDTCVLAQIHGFAELLADQLQRVADDGIIAARPGRPLACDGRRDRSAGHFATELSS